MTSKIEEAMEHIRSAEKHLKTNFLKWKPDYDSAADEYSQAAQCYRIARILDKARDYHLKASDCFKSNRSFFHAGKSIENAILVAKEITSLQDLYNQAEAAASMYQQHGSPDAAAGVLDKTAKIIEDKVPELALKLWQHAGDISSGESGTHQAAEYISKASRVLVKLGQYDQAVDSVRREIGLHLEAGNYGQVGRLTVAIVLVQLARGDAVAAEKAFKEWGNNCEAPEATLLEELIAAYDDEDSEAAKRALNNPFIKHMDVEYSRLSRTIPLPEGIGPIKSTVTHNAAPPYVPEKDRSKATEEGSGPADVASQLDVASHPDMASHPDEHASYTAVAPTADEEDELC